MRPSAKQVACSRPCRLGRELAFEVSNLRSSPSVEQHNDEFEIIDRRGEVQRRRPERRLAVDLGTRSDQLSSREGAPIDGAA